MDIPSSGAIFTLGKSHLAENTQSYFYIKNDPVKRLISGPHQSAVICGKFNTNTTTTTITTRLSKVSVCSPVHLSEFLPSLPPTPAAKTLL